jgi:hypothetical protein
LENRLRSLQNFQKARGAKQMENLLSDALRVPTTPVGQLRTRNKISNRGQLMAVRVNHRTPTPSRVNSSSTLNRHSKKSLMNNVWNWENGNTSYLPQQQNFNKNTWNKLSGGQRQATSSSSSRRPNTLQRVNTRLQSATSSSSPRRPNTPQRVNTRLQSAISGLQNLKTNEPSHGNRMQRVKNWLAGSTANHGWIPGTVIRNQRTRSEINADNLKFTGGRYFL